MTCLNANKMALLVVFAATTTIITVVSATNVNTKFTARGYNAYASASFDDSCPVVFSSSLEVSVYGSQSRFKQTGEDGNVVEANKFDDFYMLVASSSCNDTTVTTKRGAIYDSQAYGEDIETDFTIERNSLTKASLKGLEVPIYANECSYYCIEIFYPEILVLELVPKRHRPFWNAIPLNVEWRNISEMPR
jgi:hypothetical protein